MKSLFPIIAVAAAIALFYWYIDPTYTEIKELRTTEGTLDLALDRSLELQEERDQLLSRYNTFSATDVSRLEKLLPDHVDNVRLILDLDGIASKYGMRVRNVTLDKSNTRTQGTVGPDESLYESFILTFTVTGEYGTFRQFIQDLERSLRLVDVVGLSFVAAESGLYDFSISIKTYWLKP